MTDVAATPPRGIAPAPLDDLVIEIVHDDGGPSSFDLPRGGPVAGFGPEGTVLEPESLPVPVADTVRRLADEAGARVDGAMFRWNRRWSRFARAGDIRSQSRLRLHAWTPLPGLLEHLDDRPLAVEEKGRLLLASEEPLRPWRRGAHRTAATLSLRWSWPDLPVWVVAEPWWRDHSVVTISLRTNRRLRYPRRYWDGAHRALRGLLPDQGR